MWNIVFFVCVMLPTYVFLEAIQSGSTWMALLAIVTLFASLFFGCWMRNRMDHRFQVNI